jgi:hypothetical protein
VGIETVLLAVAAAGTVGSLYSQTQAANAQQKAGQAQRRQEALAAAIQRRQQVKAGRQAQAMALQAGENQGVADSSGTKGGAGSAVSQSNANLSFLDKQAGLADFAGGMFDKAARWTNRAQLFSGAADLAMMGYNTAAGDAAAKKAADTAAADKADYMAIFAGKPPTPRKGPFE